MIEQVFFEILSPAYFHRVIEIIEPSRCRTVRGAGNGDINIRGSGKGPVMENTVFEGCVPCNIGGGMLEGVVIFCADEGQELQDKGHGGLLYLVEDQGGIFPVYHGNRLFQWDAAGFIGPAGEEVL